MLSPLLFTLLTYDCSARHPSCHIVKFSDDTAVVGRITNNDESEYREEVEHLMQWCRGNNLCINVKKTKEIVVDFRRDRRPPPPLYIGGVAVEVVSSFRYLGVYRGPYLENQHHPGDQEGPPASLLPQEFAASWTWELSLEELLSLRSGEYPLHLYHCVARQLYCC